MVSKNISKKLLKSDTAALWQEKIRENPCNPWLKFWQVLFSRMSADIFILFALINQLFSPLNLGRKQIQGDIFFA